MLVSWLKVLPEQARILCAAAGTDAERAAAVDTRLASLEREAEATACKTAECLGQRVTVKRLEYRLIADFGVEPLNEAPGDSLGGVAMDGDAGPGFSTMRANFS